MSDDPGLLKRAADERRRKRSRAAVAPSVTSNTDGNVAEKPAEELCQANIPFVVEEMISTPKRRAVEESSSLHQRQDDAPLLKAATSLRLPELQHRIALRNQQVIATLAQRAQLNRTNEAERQRLIAEAAALQEGNNVNVPRVSFLGIAEHLRIHAEQLFTEANNASFMPKAVDMYADPSYSNRRRGGEEVYRKLVNSFASFPEPPTPFQWKLFAATCSACAPLIFGPAFFNDPQRWLKLVGGKFTDGIVGILTGRKTGKSTGLAYIIITLMFHISAFRCIISSKTLEQARIILTTVQALITRHPEWSSNFEIVESRATALVIRGPDRTLRVIESRCGSGEVRGPILFFPSVVWISDGGGGTHARRVSQVTCVEFWSLFVVITTPIRRYRGRGKNGPWCGAHGSALVQSGEHRAGKHSRVCGRNSATRLGRHAAHAARASCR